VSEIPYKVEWNEDGDCTVLARVVARNGSGAATGVDGEGNWIEVADLTSITCKVFDLSSSTPDTPITTPTVTIADAIKDPPVTSATLWTEDDTGYNFLHDLAASNFPTGDHRYLVEYTFTLTGGGVFHLVLDGVARSVRGS
jgi:hypothetical protein